MNMPTEQRMSTRHRRRPSSVSRAMGVGSSTPYPLSAVITRQF